MSTLTITEVLDGRLSISLKEFARLSGLTERAAYQRLKAGTLGVEVEQPRKGAPIRVPARELRRLLGAVEPGAAR